MNAVTNRKVIGGVFVFPASVDAFKIGHGDHAVGTILTGQGKPNAMRFGLAEARSGRTESRCEHAADSPTGRVAAKKESNANDAWAAIARGSAHLYFAAKRKVREWVTHFDKGCVNVPPSLPPLSLRYPDSWSDWLVRTSLRT